MGRPRVRQGAATLGVQQKLDGRQEHREEPGGAQAQGGRMAQLGRAFGHPAHGQRRGQDPVLYGEEP